MYPRIIPSTKRILSSSGLSPSSLVSVRPSVLLPLLGPSSSSRIQPASSSPIHTSPTAHQPAFQTHSSDVYRKEVDTSPPEDTTMYHVNPEAPVQKWTEPAAGEGNQMSNPEGGQYVNKSSPPAGQRYGNVESWAKDKSPETSRRGDGPEGQQASGGRKPERRH